MGAGMTVYRNAAGAQFVRWGRTWTRHVLPSRDRRFAPQRQRVRRMIAGPRRAGSDFAVPEAVAVTRYGSAFASFGRAVRHSIGLLARSSRRFTLVVAGQHRRMEQPIVMGPAVARRSRASQRSGVIAMVRRTAGDGGRLRRFVGVHDRFSPATALRVVLPTFQAETRQFAMPRHLHLPRGVGRAGTGFGSLVHRASVSQFEMGSFAPVPGDVISGAERRAATLVRMAPTASRRRESTTFVTNGRAVPQMRQPAPETSIAEPVRPAPTADMTRWVGTLFADEARRPPSGVTGFDSRLSPFFPGRKAGF